MANSSSNSNQNNLGSWILPILMLFLFPPFGVVLLVARSFSGSPKRMQSSGRHPYYMQNDPENKVGARTFSTTAPAAQQKAAFAKQREQRLAQLDSKGKRLEVIGGIITGLFCFSFLDEFSWMLRWLFQLEFDLFVYRVLDMLPWLCFTGGGVGCLLAGLRKRKQVRRFRRYLATVGSLSTVALPDLASATGTSTKVMLNDLEDMLNEELFPQGYLDYGGQRLILSGEGLESKKAPAPKPEKPSEPKPEDAILAEIRAANDAIANEKLSEQIDRIGIITAKILEYQKSRPEKAPQLHSFLSYYLPTTLKILRAYAQLEAQGVEGQNITASMDRIEGMMGKVVEGFEKQLDMLFQGDALDIATDVEVLERMLSKDGLSGTDGVSLTL